MIQLVNNDTTTSVPGDLVICSGQTFGATKALANASSHVILGVWQGETLPSNEGNVIDGLVEVNCSVNVSVGDKLYLDAVTAGKATNVAPAYSYFLGVVLAKRTLGSVQKATINLAPNVVYGLTSSNAVGVIGLPATGSITCTAASTIDDNDGFTIDDGVNTAVNFEYQKSGAAATGTITCVANSLLLDNQTVSIDDGTNTETVFEFQKTVSAKSAGYIMAIAPQNILDNETFTLNDGVHTATVFEFQKTGDFVQTSGSVVIDVRALNYAAEVAAAIKTAINGVTTTLTITAGTIDILKIPLQNDSNGAYNTAITETVVNPGFVVSGMTGGAIFTSAGGTTIVDVSGTLTATEVATRLAAAINSVTTGLTVTATSSGAVVSLINDNIDTDGNVSITETVVNAGFVVTGMSGATEFTATESTETIDIRGLTSAIQVAVKTAEVINDQDLDLIIQTPTTAVIGIINKNTGTDGNVAITKTVGCPLTVAGLSGGTAGLL
jgi:hypothetical protein